MSKAIKTAIIGGSGLSKLAGLSDLRYESVKTAYGEPSAEMTIGTIGGRDVVFLPRHGAGHTIPPHRINYRANIQALKLIGVEKIYAVAATGSIDRALKARDIVVPSQLIDYTYGREHTFFDGNDGQVEHVDLSYPYTETLRQDLLAAAARSSIAVHDGGVYAATQGPRLETIAEIDRLDRDGGTIVGMTGMPEAALARELEMSYAVISLVVNSAAGRGGAALISMQEIYEHLEKGMQNVHLILEEVLGAS